MKKIRFLDKEYNLEDLGYCGYLKSRPPISFHEWTSAGTGRRNWSAETSGPLYHLDFGTYARTPQLAATKLEKKLIRHFEQLAKTLGYEVTS